MIDHSEFVIFYTSHLVQVLYCNDIVNPMFYAMVTLSDAIYLIKVCLCICLAANKDENSHNILEDANFCKITGALSDLAISVTNFQNTPSPTFVIRHKFTLPITALVHVPRWRSVCLLTIELALDFFKLTNKTHIFLVESTQ